MTSDEARERFSEAWEGSLGRGEQYAFDRLLDDDDALRDEYARFVEVAEGTRGLGDLGNEAPVDLLPSLQARLRTQSRGRFFRDRFAQQRRTRTLSVLVVSTGILLLSAFWLALRAGLF